METKEDLDPDQRRWDQEVNGKRPTVNLKWNDVLKFPDVEREIVFIFGRDPEPDNDESKKYTGESPVKLPENPYMSRRACALSVWPDGDLIVLNPSKRRDIQFSLDGKNWQTVEKLGSKNIQHGEDLKNFQIKFTGGIIKTERIDNNGHLKSIKVQMA